MDVCGGEMADGENLDSDDNLEEASVIAVVGDLDL